MSMYIKNKFPCLGVMTGPRRATVKSAAPELVGLPLPSAEIGQTVRELYAQTERELHHAALDVLTNATLPTSLSDDERAACNALIVVCSQNHAWWDTIDSLSAVAGRVLSCVSAAQRQALLDEWWTLNAIWSDRVCILHQLRYKKSTSHALLEQAIERALGRAQPHGVADDDARVQRRRSENPDCFWIAKAIGWALRHHTAVDESSTRWVEQFVNSRTLPELSVKEALRNIEKNRSKRKRP